MAENILILEADATNPHDPLALSNTALDLTLDDASLGFRRIHASFTEKYPQESFRTLRVYLGNSMEIARTGGGHAYTLRHRVRYAKEVDVLIDSRAPVLVQILDWCKRVAGKDRQLFFQTSSRDYFLSLRKILQFYGYEIYDPLDLRTLERSNSNNNNKQGSGIQAQHNGNSPIHDYGIKTIQAQPPQQHPQPLPPQNEQITNVPTVDQASLFYSFLKDPNLGWMGQDHGVLDMWSPSSIWSRTGTNVTVGNNNSNINNNMNDDDDDDDNNRSLNTKEKRNDDSEMLRRVTKLSKLPRLVHMPTTAETVNAVEALIQAGEVDATNCCAILERQEGLAALEYTLRRKSDLVQSTEKRHWWISKHGDKLDTIYGDDDEDDDKEKSQKKKKEKSSSSLQMICTSSVYDDLFRQVRIWARMGFSNAQIQKEMDLQFHQILEYSHEAQKGQALEELEEMKVEEKKKPEEPDELPDK